MTEFRYWLSIILLCAAVIVLVILSGCAVTKPKPDPDPGRLCGEDISHAAMLDREKFFDEAEEPLIETIKFGAPGEVSHMIMMVQHDDGTVVAVVKFASRPGLVFHLGTCRQQSEDEFIDENFGYVERIRHSTALPYEPGH